MTVTLFQASELEIRSVVREVPPPQEEGEGVTSSAPADSDIGCICGYLASLRALLAVECTADCIVALGRRR